MRWNALALGEVLPFDHKYCVSLFRACTDIPAIGRLCHSWFSLEAPLEQFLSSLSPLEGNNRPRMPQGEWTPNENRCCIWISGSLVYSPLGSWHNNSPCDPCKAGSLPRRHGAGHTGPARGELKFVFCFSLQTQCRLNELLCLRMGCNPRCWWGASCGGRDAVVTATLQSSHDLQRLHSFTSLSWENFILKGTTTVITSWKLA